jgi:RES domain-containing protein
VRFAGLAYRAHNPAWSWQPLSGEGARLHGGRFNAKGVPALYLSLSYSTAVLEATQGFGQRFPPLTLVTYDVDCEDIADLRKPSVRKSLRVKDDDLACAWMLLAAEGRRVPSWEIAARLMRRDLAGIIVRSFATGATPEDANLVLWSWSVTLPNSVRVVDPGRRLPRDGRSWGS